MEPTNSELTNSPPPPYHEEKLSTSSNPSSLLPPGCGWTNEQISHRSLVSHAVSLFFAIPALALFVVDLHAYSSQTHPNTYSTTHPTRYFYSNPIAIDDGIALAMLSITILYSATYLFSFRPTRQLLAPATIYRYIILFCITDTALCVTILTISCNVLSTRVATANCYRFLYLDEGACDSHRRSIVKAAGSLGVLTSVGIQLRWGMILHLCLDRWRRWRSQRTG